MAIFGRIIAEAIASGISVLSRAVLAAYNQALQSKKYSLMPSTFFFRIEIVFRIYLCRCEVWGGSRFSSSLCYEAENANRRSA
jgi:hypothetical protein